MNVLRNIEARSCTHCYSGKEINITQPVCVFVALVIQHAMRMRHIILQSVACPSVQNFSTLSHKRNDFRKRSYRTKAVCFDFLLDFCMKRFTF